MPFARGGDGVCWLPDGDEVYRYLILAYTGLDDDPRAIHEFGLARIAAIKDEMLAIARELGHDDIASLRAFLATDPSNHATDPAAMVALATDQIERTTAVAPAWFGRLPVSPVEVRAVEPHQERDAPPAWRALDTLAKMNPPWRPQRALAASPIGPTDLPGRLSLLKI